MQWTREVQAGFTKGKPWLPVEKDYRHWCVEAEAESEESVLSYYRRLTALRARLAVLTAGDYEELLPDDERIYAFRRTLGGEKTVTLVNFTLEPVNYDMALVDGLTRADGSYLEETEEPGTLQPLEAVIYTNCQKKE